MGKGDIKLLLLRVVQLIPLVLENLSVVQILMAVRTSIRSRSPRCVAFSV